MKPDLVSGSPLWQAVFVSFALVLMLFQIARGWRLGLPRQLVRIAALVAAYAVALFAGRALVPLLRPLITVPDFVISALGGTILALIVYSLVNTLGAILFKRTGQQSSSVLRLIYGASGAFLGIFFGAFFVWLLVVSVRTVGAIAEAEVNSRAPARISSFDEHKTASRNLNHRTMSDVPDQNSLIFSLARLKKSIELGTVGNVVRQTDVLPSGVYETLGKVGEVFSKPERAARFLADPDIAKLADNPKILALRADPEVERMLREGRLFDLLQDDRLIDAANDPELKTALKNFDLKGALDRALKEK